MTACTCTVHAAEAKQRDSYAGLRETLRGLLDLDLGEPGTIVPVLWKDLGGAKTLQVVSPTALMAVDGPDTEARWVVELYDGNDCTVRTLAVIPVGSGSADYVLAAVALEAIRAYTRHVERGRHEEEPF